MCPSRRQSEAEASPAVRLAARCTNRYVPLTPQTTQQATQHRRGMDAVLAPRGPAWHSAAVRVVDNEPVTRSLVRRMLEEGDFRVEEARDGESALALIQLRSEPFDLVLTDLSMPGIDGRQVSETLARYRPSLAVLCMSGDPDGVPRITSTDTPVRVMLKPFMAEDLYQAVRNAMTRAADLTAIAEHEIELAHAGLSKLAIQLEASRLMRVTALDLVAVARELRRS